MAVISFNFTSINVEKKAPIKGKVSISNNVEIKKVEETKLALGASNQDGLRFEFDFLSKFEPGIGSINLKGEVISLEDPKVVKSVIKEWKKSKNIPKEIRKGVLNHVLNKCNIEALLMSKEINLPSPIPLPKIQEK